MADWAPGIAGAAGGVEVVCGATSSIVFPHAPQNLAVGEMGALQLGHVGSAGDMATSIVTR